MNNKLIFDDSYEVSSNIKKRRELYDSFTFLKNKQKFNFNEDDEESDIEEDNREEYEKHIRDENILLKRRNEAIENKTRYQKYFTTSVTIDSRDRDSNKYPKPNKYQVFLNKEFENIEKIELISTEIPNTIEPVNISNNKIKWENISYDDYISRYYPLANTSVTDAYNQNNFVTTTTSYEVNIPTGYYNTDNLNIELISSMNEIPDEFNKPHCFYLDININTHLVTLIQRSEEVIINNMSMTKDSSLLTIEVENINNIDNSTWLNTDVILTDCIKIGGIPSKYINLKEFEVTSVTTNTIIVDILTNANITQTIQNLNTTKIRVGRVIHFSLPQLSFSESDNTNADGTVNSILKVLGFPVPSGQYVVIGTKIPSRAIHLNEEYILERYIKAVSGIDNDLTDLTDSLHTLNIQNIGNNEYIFRSEPYLFMRLIIPGNDKTNLGDNILTSISNSGAIEKKNIYYNNPFQSLIDNEKQLLVKDVSNIFSKIQLSSIPGNISLNSQIHSEKIYYDTPLRKLNNIIIELLDSQGKIIDLKSDHSFTIKITEKIDVLKNSLMNSRTGDTVTSGINLTSLNKFN